MPENRGDPTIEGENEVWPDFHPSDFVVGDPGFAPQPEGTGPIFPILSSLVAPVVNYSALLAPKTQKNWLPPPPPGLCEQALVLPLSAIQPDCYRNVRYPDLVHPLSLSVSPAP